MLVAPRVLKKMKKNRQELVEAKQRREQTVSSTNQPHMDNDECTIFGQLIAKKMRNLSEERRDVMMVKINQLFVDEHNVNRPCSASSKDSPSPSLLVEPIEEYLDT